MNKDPVNPSQKNEEEYQFTDEESGHKYESPAAASPSSLAESGDNAGARRKKLILIIIGVIIGAFCLYKLYGLFSAGPSKTTLAPTQVQTALALAAAPAAAQKSGQITPPKPILSEEKLERESLKRQVTTLEQTVIQNRQTQENLQNQIGGISSAISEIQSNIAMLTQQVNTIAQKSEAEAKLKEKAEAARKAEEAKKAAKKAFYEKKKKEKVSYATYYIRAMIQGRAWLVGSNDAAFTISTGDQLPGYGQIQNIDPDKGIVMTSSGRMINYMSRDR